MTIAEVNINLIGRKVSVINTGLRVEGVIADIWEDKYAKGVRVIHEPVNWGGEYYTNLLSTARKCDGEGNLKYTELI